MELQKEKSKKKKTARPKSVDHKTSVVIPYVEGVSEAVARVYIMDAISTAMRPTRLPYQKRFGSSEAQRKQRRHS